MSRVVWPKPGSIKTISIIDATVVPAPEDGLSREAWELGTSTQLRVKLLTAKERNRFRREFSRLWTEERDKGSADYSEILRELVIACVVQAMGPEFNDGSRLADIPAGEELADALDNLDLLQAAGFAAFTAQSPRKEQLD